MTDGFFSFTRKARGRTNVLISPVFIGDVIVESKTEDPFDHKEYEGIWDTGATGSVITSKVVKECGLKPTGGTWVQLAGKKDFQNTYLVSIGLPNRVLISPVRVTEAKEIGGCDVLIGMDIISQGDFAVSHGNNKTTFTFRIPSKEVIDFVITDAAETGQKVHTKETFEKEKKTKSKKKELKSKRKRKKRK